jgi:hypothetical protein
LVVSDDLGPLSHNCSTETADSDSGSDTESDSEKVGSPGKLSKVLQQFTVALKASYNPLSFLLAVGPECSVAYLLVMNVQTFRSLLVSLKL